MATQQFNERSDRRSGKPQQTVEAGAQLRRALSVWGAAAFVVTSMIGTGIFTVPADVRAATGNGVASLGVWITGAALALFGAFCYAELATRMPKAGGEYQYLLNVYGRPWAFIGGWITFFAGFAAPTSASALKVVEYFSHLAPGWDPNAPLIGGLGVTQGSAVAALLPLLLALAHSIGVRPSGQMQTTLATMTVCAIIVFTVAGVSSGRGDWGGVTQGSQATGAWWVALIQVSFAYSGWNNAAYLAGEVTEPRLYYAVARDGLAPSIFGRLGKRSQAPIVAIFTQAAIASVMALTGTFGELLLYVGSALLLISALTVAAVYVVRRAADDDPKRNFSVPGYPFTPAVYILLVILSWIHTLREKPKPAVYALVTIAAGVAVYYLGRALGWIAAAPKTRPEAENSGSDL